MTKKQDNWNIKGLPMKCYSLKESKSYIHVEPLKLKGIKKLENLVYLEEKLHERQFNELLRFYEKNPNLTSKIIIKGKYNAKVWESELKNKKVYPYNGINLALKESVNGVYPLPPNPATFIFYIPKTKKFISVKSSVVENNGKFIREYFGFEKMTKEEVKPYFMFYKIAGVFLGKSSKPISSIKYSSYKFKNPWQKVDEVKKL